MAWTQPKTWASEPLTSSDLNTHLRDNLEALKDPPSATYILNESSNYTTTSGSFVDVDATNLALTIETNGGAVLVAFFAMVNNSSAGQVIYLDVDVDGNRWAGNDGIVGHVFNGTGSVMGFLILVEGLAAASHTFTLQWAVSGGTGKIYAGAGTTNADVHPQFIVREVS